MNLGQRIYKLRTEKGLSQDALAEMLDVSRQSISKWENNGAVPELEKLIRLSEIFELSLDELVKGEDTSIKIKSETDRLQDKQDKNNETGFPPRKIVGTILLCMSFLVVMLILILVGSFGGIILALPFLTSGILCFLLKKNVGLWCAWDVYILLDICMTYATGIRRANVLYSFQWTWEMNYMRLAIAWLAVISLVVMIAVTVVRFGKYSLASEKDERKKTIVVWVVLILIQLLTVLWVHSGLHRHLIDNIFEMGFIFQLINIVFSWARIAALTVALVFTSRFIKTRKSSKVHNL